MEVGSAVSFKGVELVVGVSGFASTNRGLVAASSSGLGMGMGSSAFFICDGIASLSKVLLGVEVLGGASARDFAV